jgi:hypothetical protein
VSSKYARLTGYPRQEFRPPTALSATKGLYSLLVGVFIGLVDDSLGGSLEVFDGGDDRGHQGVCWARYRVPVRS